MSNVEQALDDLLRNVHNRRQAGRFRAIEVAQEEAANHYGAVMLPAWLVEGKPEADIYATATKFRTALTYAETMLDPDRIRQWDAAGYARDGLVRLSALGVIAVLVRVYRVRAGQDAREQAKGLEWLDEVAEEGSEEDDESRPKWLTSLVNRVTPGVVDTMDQSNTTTASIWTYFHVHWLAWALLDLAGDRDLVDVIKQSSDQDLEEAVNGRFSVGSVERAESISELFERASLDVIQRHLDNLAPESMPLPKLRQLIRGDEKQGNGRTPKVPPVLQQPLISIPSDLATRAILGAIHQAESGRNWSDHGGATVPTHTTRTNRGHGVVYVSMRGIDEQSRPATELLPMLWQEVHACGDLTSDAFLVCMAQWAAEDAGPREPVWMTAEAILDARGVRRMQRKNEPGNWQHGHRAEDRIAAGRALAQLNGLWLDLNTDIIPAGKRRKARRLRHQSKALAMLDIITEMDVNGNAVFLAARVMPGTWAEQLWESDLRQRGLLARKALEYDPVREQVEKRLAKFLAFHFRINALRPAETVRLHTGTLMKNVDLEPDRANPQRTKARLEKALSRLKADGVIAGWGYAVGEDLPARGWFPKWAKMAVWIDPPQEIPAHYAQLRNGARTTRALPAAPS